MCLAKCCVFIFLALFLECYHALNCHSEGGPKVEQLKQIYMTCLKRQDGKNNSNRGYSGDDNWNSRGNNQKWERERGLGTRDERMSGRDDRMNDRDYRNSGNSGRDDRSSSKDNNRDRMNDGYNRDDRMNDGYSRDERTGNRNDRMGSRDMMGRNNEGYGKTEVTGRDGFPINDDFGTFGQESTYNSYRSTTQSPRRFRRDKRTGMNSGQRSQYNPNASTRKPDYDDSYRNNDDRNNKENNTSSNKEIDKKACALHCFMENLDMTADNGMPDKYLVTHAITKDVKNEDLRDFLQESIEECFQILNNENTEDKCEFSMNLLMCLSEKGRANCDDWKDEAIQI